MSVPALGLGMNRLKKRMRVSVAEFGLAVAREAGRRDPYHRVTVQRWLTEQAEPGVEAIVAMAALAEKFGLAPEHQGFEWLIAERGSTTANKYARELAKQVLDLWLELNESYDEMIRRKIPAIAVQAGSVSSAPNIMTEEDIDALEELRTACQEAHGALRKLMLGGSFD